MAVWLSIPELKVQLDQRDDRGTFTNDPLLSASAAYACDWVEQQAARQFLSSAYSRAFVGDGHFQVYLPEWPVTAVSRLVVGTSTVNIGTMTQFRQGSVDAYWTKQSVNYPRVGFERDEIVEIDWTGGFAATEIPSDVKHLAVSVALLAYKESDRWGDQQKNLATQTTIFERNLPPQDKLTLAALRAWPKLMMQPGTDIS